MPARSPVLFWLLMAATVCVDLAAGVMRIREPYSATETLYLGLALGQLSAVCIWAAYSAYGTLSRWLSYALAVVIASIATVFIESQHEVKFLSPLALYASHVMVVVIALWLLRALRNRREAPTATQFSVKNLLFLMTIVAFVSTMIGRATGLHHDGLFLAVSVLGNAIVAVGCVISRRDDRHPILALSIAIAVALVTAWWVSRFRPESFDQAVVMYCVQTITISAWLEWGGIIADGDAAAGNPQPTEPAGLEPMKQ